MAAEGKRDHPWMAETHAEDCPECRQGKHGNCTGWVIHPITDLVVDCPCAEGGHL